MIEQITQRTATRERVVHVQAVNLAYQRQIDCLTDKARCVINAASAHSNELAFRVIDKLQ